MRACTVGSVRRLCVTNVRDINTQYILVFVFRRRRMRISLRIELR